jgi:hypothetical protein
MRQARTWGCKNDAKSEFSSLLRSSVFYRHRRGTVSPHPWGGEESLRRQLATWVNSQGEKRCPWGEMFGYVSTMGYRALPRRRRVRWGIANITRYGIRRRTGNCIIRSHDWEGHDKAPVFTASVVDLGARQKCPAFA